jgi:hypothetical protein
MFKRVLIKVWDFGFYSCINFRHFIRHIIFINKTERPIGMAIDLQKNGIIKLKANGLSEYLIPLIENPKNLNKKSEEYYLIENTSNDYGIKGINVDIQSEFLWRYIFTKENYEILKSYYRGPFYLRNNPYIAISYDKESHGAQNFHVDWGLRQCSIMVNLTDIDSSSTHMEYLLGTNRRYWFKHPHRLSEKFKTIVASHKSHYPHANFTTQSPKDTLFIFDAGNGLHRQVPGGKRIILHLNFVDNLAYTGWKHGWEPSEAFKESYWFSEIGEKTLEKISNSGIPQSFFSLVLQQAKPNVITPKIYSKNYNL